MEYLGDLIQFTGGLIAKIDTASFFIGMVLTVVSILAFAIWDDRNN